MEKNLLIAVSIFLIVIFLLWKITIDSYKKEYPEKTWKKWGPKAYFWQANIIFSSLITGLILFLLRWGNLMTF